MWKKWEENGFKPTLKPRHFKTLVLQVVKGKLAELGDDEKE